MSEFDLKFQVPATISREEAGRTFYWPVNRAGTFNTRLGPRLGRLGPVRPANVDLFRIAAMVYAADRSVKRRIGSVNWTRRSFELTVPVQDPDPWNEVSSELQALLDFLSGDEWRLAFRRARVPREQIADNQYPDAERVVLMSGGADSAVGALLARMRPESHILVSHVGATAISPIQQDVASRVRNLLPGGSYQNHLQVMFTRFERQPGEHKLPSEVSTRTRSLLFLALGLSVASVNGIPLWIPENGFASLNPPLGPDQLGSLSTRSTHPWFLEELTGLAQRANAWADVTNPFAMQTKGEMFRWVAKELGNDDAATDFLSATSSCAYTNRRWLGIKAKEHCGTCFSCLVRRASFAASGLADRSTYVSDAWPNERVRKQLQQASILPSIRGFVARGVGVSDIAAMRLPAGYTATQAHEVCQRGAEELGMLL